MPAVRRIALAYNNVYVVEAGGDCILVDTGPDYRGAFEELRAALGPARPSAIVATHGHLDHAGLAASWQREGIRVLLGPGDLALAVRDDAWIEAESAGLQTFIEASGAPSHVRAELLAGLKRRRRWAVAALEGYPPDRSRHWPTGLRYERFCPDAPAADGAPAGPGLRVVACPGHTPGNVVLVHEDEGWLFSGDQLLPGLTPTPAVQLRPGGQDETGWRFRSLPAFVASLRALRGRGLVRCFPGHGEPFEGVDTAIAANLAAIEERSERVHAALDEAAPAMPYAVAERLYPRALERRFWQIVPTVLGHLDLLEDEGRATRLPDGRYAPS